MSTTISQTCVQIIIFHDFEISVYHTNSTQANATLAPLYYLQNNTAKVSVDNLILILTIKKYLN